MVQALKEKWNQGGIGLVQLVGWGLTLTTFFGGLTYASYTSTSNRVNATEVKLAGQEATITAMRDDIKEMKNDVKELLKRK